LKYQFTNVIKYFQSWLARRRLLNYDLRRATENDLDFIMNEIIDGARNGHYASTLLDSEEQKGLYGQLINVINFSAMERNSHRGVEKIEARLWVYGSSTDDQVGYVLASEKFPGSKRELELYQVGVRKDRLKLGHGRRIVQLFLAAMPATANLYARCFHPSQAMFFLLKEVGFSHTNTTRGGTRELELSRQEQNKNT